MKALAEKLKSVGQTPWTSPTRLSCLLLILRQIDFATKVRNDRRLPGIPFSNRLARQFSSKLRIAPAGVAREPLGALLRTGLIEQLSPARLNPFAKHSARYRLTPEGRRLKLTSVECTLTMGAERKLAAAPKRLDRGLNRRWPFRAALLLDLSKLTLPDTESARVAVDSLMESKDFRACTRAVLSAIATREHTARVQPSGQITTSLNSCPRLLKPHLCIAGEPVALCDIASAHWAFLPRLITNRLDYCRKRGDAESRLAPLIAELHRLVELCSSGSFYESTLPAGATTADIKHRKKLLNVLLNSSRSKAANNCVWHALRRQFPLCVGIIDSIKREDYRAISRQLQHFTAKAITTALLDMQQQGLPAIPDTDCLIVRGQDRDAACHAIGSAIFDETGGVCVTVNGIRFNNKAEPKTAIA